MNRQKLIDRTAFPVLSLAAAAFVAIPVAAIAGGPAQLQPAAHASTVSIQAPATEADLSQSVGAASNASGQISAKQITQIAQKFSVDEEKVRSIAKKIGATVQGPGVSAVTVSAKGKLISGHDGEVPSGAIVAPAPGVVLDGGQYGWRFAPDAVGAGALEFHNGTDIAAPAGTPVVSALPEGKVTSTFWDPWGGNRVEVTHPNGMKTTYSHLLKVQVEVDDELRAGQQLGTMGATGARVTGPHLHFELWKDGKTVDPQSYDWITDTETIPAVNDGYELSPHTPPAELDGVPTAPTGEEIKKAAQKEAQAEDKTKTEAKNKSEVTSQTSGDIKAKKPAAKNEAKPGVKKPAVKDSAKDVVKGAPKAEVKPAPVVTKPSAPAAPAPEVTAPVPAAPVATPSPAPVAPAPTPTPTPVVTPTPSPTPSPSATVESGGVGVEVAPVAELLAWTSQDNEVQLRVAYASRTADTDGDGVLDYLDADIDGDGVPNWLDPDITGDGILNIHAKTPAAMWTVQTR